MEVDWDTVEDFGQVSDREIARRIGRSTTQVRYQRAKRGIAPYTTHTRVKDIDWQALRDEAFAQGPDRVLAEQLGCSTRCVWRERTRRGILAHAYGAST